MVLANSISSSTTVSSRNLVTITSSSTDYDDLKSLLHYDPANTNIVTGNGPDELMWNLLQTAEIILDGSESDDKDNGNLKFFCRII